MAIFMSPVPITDHDHHPPCVVIPQPESRHVFDEIIHGPPTRLPLLNTTFLPSLEVLAPKLSSSHFLSINDQPTFNDVEELLQRFAAFLGAVADTDEVCYLASVLGDDSKPLKSIVHAVLRDNVADGSKCQLDKLRVPQNDRLYDSMFDFAVTIVTSTVDRVAHHQPETHFSLLIKQSNTGSNMDIHLACSKTHVPKPAAEQLLRLMLRYLVPQDIRVEALPSSPSLSVLNYPAASISPPGLPWDTLPEFPLGAQLIHHAFVRRARETPDRVAIDYLTAQHGRISVTYADTLQQVDALADCITRVLDTITWPSVRGHQRVVPIFMTANPELYITVLAILKAGHAFCPLPVDSPQERIFDILHDLEAPVVLGRGPERFTCAGTALSGFDKLADKIWLDVLDGPSWPVFSETSKNFAPYSLATIQGVDDLAYVYYTSGSTGKPKGVQISHLAATCAISANAAAMPELSSRRDLRWFQLAVPTFDAFILDVFFTFSAGGCLCIAERDLALTDLEGAMNTLEANVTHTVPSLAMTMRRERLKTIRTLICIGEKIGSRIVESFSIDSPSNSQCSPVRLINVYGPTEATINVTTQNFTSTMRGTIIGKPLSTASLIVIDEKTFQAVPSGLPGHLAIGGPQLSNGYLNRPTENSKQFILSEEFGRLYLTGDKARVVWNEQGEPILECLGRTQDGQVKLNGRRVELEEIDSVLLKCDAVKEVATVTVDSSTGTQLYACVVPSAGHTEADVQAACQKIVDTNLPGWMHPRRYFLFPFLTRNVSGKIDQTSLRESAQATCAVESTRKDTSFDGLTMGHSAREKLPSHVPDQDIPLAICKLLKECTNDPSIKITSTTSLFAIGFDSLRSITFLQKARDININELGIQDMLKGLTPAALATIVSTRRQIASRKLEKGNGIARADCSGGNRELSSILSHFDGRCRLLCAKRLCIPLDHIESVLPATYTQTRMVANFLMAQTKSVPKPWVEHFIYDIPEGLDSHRFQEAVFSVLRRHPCHRTVFNLVDDPVAPAAQVILVPTCSEATIPWSNKLCTAHEDDEGDAIERLIEQTQQTVDEQMRLERPPLAVTFIRSIQSGRCVFLLSMFHGIYDGASLKLLRQEIMMEYHHQNAPARTSITTSTKVHFGADQKNTLKFWISKLAVTPYYKLAGVPSFHAAEENFVQLKVDYNDPRSIVSVFTKRSKVLHDGLEDKAKSVLLTSPLSVVQAAWALVLLECQQLMDHTRSQDEKSSYDVSFGSTIHGRHSQESQLCMGPMLATVPVCLAGDTSDDTAETNREMCNILANEHAEALEHLQIPCPSLEFAQSSTRFDTTLILQTFGEGEPDQSADFPGFEAGDNWLPAFRGSDFCMPILVEILPGKDEILDFRCTFQNSSSDYPWLNSTTASYLMDMFEANLIWIMANPDAVFDYRARGSIS